MLFLTKPHNHTLLKFLKVSPYGFIVIHPWKSTFAMDYTLEQSKSKPFTDCFTLAGS